MAERISSAIAGIDFKDAGRAPRSMEMTGSSPRPNVFLDARFFDPSIPATTTTLLTSMTMASFVSAAVTSTCAYVDASVMRLWRKTNSARMAAW